MPHHRIGLFLAAAVSVAAGLSPAAGQTASRRDADLLKQKVAAVAKRGAAPSRQPLRTTVTEREVNAYLTYEVTDLLPPGVVDPAVSILGTGRLSGRAVVDLDRVREGRDTGLLDPMSYLTGRLPVVATGTLRTANGVARFQLESASVASVPVPKILLQQIVSYYSRSPDDPDGISLDDPFVLPARIREIQVERGWAVIVQ